MTARPMTFAEPREGETEEAFLERYRASIPPVIYLPLECPLEEGQDARIELRATQDGRVALLAYSALDRLEECCGPHQPWALFATTDLEAIKEQSPFDVVFFDMVMPEELRRGPSGEVGAPS